MIIVYDGEVQQVESKTHPVNASITGAVWYADMLPEEQRDLFCKFNSSCKNLGLLAAKNWHTENEYVVVLDDDVFPELPWNPENDPIQDHIDALNMRVPISWFQITTPVMRGFPYAIRSEAPVMFSHGVWMNVPDADAVATLWAYPDQPKTPEFYVGPIPKGIYAPICGMNVAFRREALPFVYFAPTAKFHGAQRFDDIWMGLLVVEEFAKRGWAIYTGLAKVWHSRASNVWANLQKEAVGLEVNESLWRGYDGQNKDALEFLKAYNDKYSRWKVLMETT